MADAKGGAPKGNDNAKRGTMFRDSLRARLLRGDDSPAVTRIDRITEQLVRQAMDGEMAALREVADRMDGKAPQSIAVGGDDSLPPIPVLNVSVGRN